MGETAAVSLGLDTAANALNHFCRAVSRKDGQQSRIRRVRASLTVDCAQLRARALVVALLVVTDPAPNPRDCKRGTREACSPVEAAI